MRFFYDTFFPVVGTLIPVVRVDVSMSQPMQRVDVRLTLGEFPPWRISPQHGQDVTADLDQRRCGMGASPPFAHEQYGQGGIEHPVCGR